MRRLFPLLLLIFSASSLSAQWSEDVLLSSDLPDSSLPNSLTIQVAEVVRGDTLIVWGTRSRNTDGSSVPSLFYASRNRQGRLTEEEDRPDGFVGIVPLSTSFLVVWNDHGGGVRARRVDAVTGVIGTTMILQTDRSVNPTSTLLTTQTSDGRRRVIWVDTRQETWTWFIDPIDGEVVESKRVSSENALTAQALYWPDGRVVVRVGDTTALFLSSDAIESKWFNWKIANRPTMYEGDTLVVLTDEGLAFYRSLFDPIPIALYPGTPTDDLRRLIISRDSIGYYAAWLTYALSDGDFFTSVRRYRFDSAGTGSVETVASGRGTYGYGYFEAGEHTDSVIQGCGRASFSSFHGRSVLVRGFGGGRIDVAYANAFATDSLGRLYAAGDPAYPRTYSFSSCRIPSLPPFITPYRRSKAGLSTVAIGSWAVSTVIEPAPLAVSSHTPVIVSGDDEPILFWNTSTRIQTVRAEGGFRGIDLSRIKWDTRSILPNVWTYWGGRVAAYVPWSSVEVNGGRQLEYTHRLIVAVLGTNGWRIHQVDSQIVRLERNQSIGYVIQNVSFGYDPVRHETYSVYDIGASRVIVRYDRHGEIVSRTFTNGLNFARKKPLGFGLVAGSNGTIALHHSSDSVSVVDPLTLRVSVYSLPTAPDSLSVRPNEQPNFVTGISGDRYLRRFTPQPDSGTTPISWSARVEVRSLSGHLLGARRIPIPDASATPFILQNPADDAIIILVPGNGLTFYYLSPTLSSVTTEGGTLLDSVAISRTRESVASPTGIVVNDTLFVAWEDSRDSGITRIYGNHWPIPRGLKNTTDDLPLNPMEQGGPLILPSCAITGISPNPVYRRMTVEIEVTLNQRGRLELFNMRGEAVLSMPIELYEGRRQYPLNVSNVPSGAYEVRVTGTMGSANESVIIMGE